MDSKEITLKERFSTESLTEQQYDDILEAMDTHARNCMIEVVLWYITDSNRKYAEKVVDGFLSSEYFKDLQK